MIWPCGYFATAEASSRPRKSTRTARTDSVPKSNPRVEACGLMPGRSSKPPNGFARGTSGYYAQGSEALGDDPPLGFPEGAQRFNHFSGANPHQIERALNSFDHRGSVASDAVDFPQLQQPCLQLIHCGTVVPQDGFIQS